MKEDSGATVKEEGDATAKLDSEATAKEEQAQTQEQINALKAMITDMDQKPQKPRIREMAKLLNVPQKKKQR